MNIDRKVKFKISNKQIEKLGDYFKNNLNSVFRNSVDKYLTAYVRVHWKEVVGSTTYRHSRVVNITNGTLFLRAWPDTWSNEIRACQNDIVAKVNAFAGKNIAREISFKPYEPEKKENIPKLVNNAALKRKVKLDVLTEEEKKEISESLSKVTDKDLKKVLRKYATLSKKVQNYRRDNLTKCKICGKFKGKEICDDCIISGEQKLKEMVIKLLSDLPYLGFADASKEIPNLSPDFFNKVRFEMIQRQAKKVRLKDGVTLEAKCLTMLYKSMPPEFLNDDIVMETLKFLRYDLAESGIFSKKDFKSDFIKPKTQAEIKEKPRQ